MRVRIDREREERSIKTGRFARAHIPAYRIHLAVTFSEEERYLLRHTGIGQDVFFRSPIPPDVTDPDAIKKLKAEKLRPRLRPRPSRLRAQDANWRLA